MTERPVLVLFVRAPVAGRVKTRLAPALGSTGAAAWYRHCTAALLRRLGRDRRWRCLLAVTPDGARRSRHWPPQIERIAQGPGDLGARMARVFRALPAGPAAIIGSDIPGLRAAHVAEAFRVLRGADAVFGPAPDGGYWLVGLARAGVPLPPGLFRNVRWSTRHALADTLAGLRGRRVRFGPPLADVDGPEDLAG